VGSVKRVILAVLSTDIIRFGVLLIMLTSAVAGSAATPDQAPLVAADQARVWFLQQLLPGSDMFAPMIYANGASIAISSQGTVFYRDFAPGTYAFTVQNCPASPQAPLTLPLAPGNQIALQIQSGMSAPDGCIPGNILYLNLAPADGLADLFAPLAYLGAR
jgi:hypothetical protein